jgi:hypothetical protein
MASAAALIGETVSHYRIIEKLGSGGMGVVYKRKTLAWAGMLRSNFYPRTLPDIATLWSVFGVKPSQHLP